MAGPRSLPYGGQSVRRILVISALSLVSLAAPTVQAEVGDDVRSLLRAGDWDASGAALYALAHTGDDDAEYMLGRLLVEQGHPAAAIPWLEAVPSPWESPDGLEDRRLYWLARAYSASGDHARALQAAGAALTSPVRERLSTRELPELRLIRADALHASGRSEDALEGWRRVTSSNAPRDLKAAALRRVADHQPGQAGWDATRRLLMSFPDLPAALDPGLRFGPDDLGLRDRFQRAKSLMTRFRYHEARQALAGLATDRAYGPESRWLLAVIAVRKLRDDPDGARVLLEQVIRRDDAHREEALFLLMRTYIKQDRYREALAVADRYDRRYPGGEFRERVAYYRAFLPYDERRCDVAIPQLRRYIKTWGARRSTARGFLAWCMVREGRWKEAISSYEEIVRYGGAITRGKAWFWQAWSLDQLGRRDDARAKLARLQRDYPLTWYDMHGRQLLARWDGRDPRASAVPWPEGGGHAVTRHPMDPAAWSWPKLGKSYAARLLRVRRLVEVGDVDHARTAYKPIREAVEKAVPASRRSRFVRFMGAAVEDFERGWRRVSGGRLGALLELPDAEDVSYLLGYPRAYAPLVERLGAAAGVPAAFVYGIMRQESRYQPAMISAMDAVGALQMIPQTAELVAADLGLTYDATTFADPRVGFPYSLHYMKVHDRLWHGQLVLTAASYNAGPEPIARWLRENEGAPLVTLVEEFSYSEARAYARKVAEHTLRNLYLYEPDPARRGAVLDRLFPVDVDYAPPEDVGY